MAAFSADPTQLERLYTEHIHELFALAYLHTAKPSDAEELLYGLFADISASEKANRLAMSGKDGLLRLAHRSCMDYYLAKMRKPIKERDLDAQRLPFSMSAQLKALLRLSYTMKTPLFLRYRLGLSYEESAKILGCTAGRVKSLVRRGLQKAGISEGETQKALHSIALGSAGTSQRIYDKLTRNLSDKKYMDKQNTRRFKRKMDHAVPYVTLGILLILLFAFLAVNFGWFGTDPGTQIPGLNTSSATASEILNEIKNGAEAA